MSKGTLRAGGLGKNLATKGASSLKDLRRAPFLAGLLIAAASILLFSSGISGRRGLLEGFGATQDRAAEQPSSAGLKDLYTLRIYLGVKDAAQTRWDGRILVEGGSIVRLKGWRFREQDRVGLDNWEVTTQEVGTEQIRLENFTRGIPRKDTGLQVLPKEVFVFVRGGDRTQIRVTTLQGDFSFRLSDLRFNQPKPFLEGKVEVRLLPGVVRLSDGFRQSDFPAVEVDSKGNAWVVWASYGSSDEIHLRKFGDQQWYMTIRVPGVSGDVWRPKLAIDRQDRVWVVWSQQVEGNWDIYTVALDGNKWLKPVKLSAGRGPDMNVEAAVDGDGNLWVVWQGFSNGNSDIFLRALQKGQWTETMRVTSDPSNDWNPVLAIDSKGKLYVAWDSYRNGNYDVFLKSYFAGAWSEEVALSNSADFDANASIVTDFSDRVWVAWDRSGPNWGKDQGTGIEGKGIPLYASRSVELRCISNGKIQAPVLPLESSLPEGQRIFCHSPKLLVDRQGRLWVFFRHLSEKPEKTGWPPKAPGEPLNPDYLYWFRGRVYWSQFLTSYEGDAWAEAVELPESMGRISALADLALAPDDRIWLVWPTDQREYWFSSRPLAHEIFAASVGLSGSPGAYQLVETQKPVQQVQPVHPAESKDIEAIRSYRTWIDGREARILRGDLHRHTELSWDSVIGTDSSLLDFYRYAIDVADLDFGAVTDHHAGGVGWDFLSKPGTTDYYWWYTQKTTDLFHVPDRFVTLYAYERSINFPFGHRNIFYPRRHLPLIPLFSQPGIREEESWLSPKNEVVPLVADNDTELLYRELDRTGGFAIPHTPGTRHGGTDWKAYNPDKDPVVEIYQGRRHSYEHVGAPRASNEANPDYRPQGMIWNAWEKGYRLGVIASSDHVSTHVSYAMVFSADYSRSGIMEAILRRHTYAATDNIILELRAGDHFMGDEFSTEEPPVLTLKVRGTAPISKISIIKNNRYVYVQEPKQKVTDLTWLDNHMDKLRNYYYVRVEQEDGQLAWSSPIWVNYVGRLR